jgi:hypothetical protein
MTRIIPRYCNILYSNFRFFCKTFRRYRPINASCSLVKITYFGHATLLINMDGVRLLTDPLLRSRLLT